MAKKWNANRDQNLLLLLIQDVKIDFNTLPQKWIAKYPAETFQPTSKAFSEHVAKLKRNVKSSTNPAGSAKTWTAARDQNLLLLLIQEVKVDFSKLPASWAKKYPNETFQPTAKAFSEHVAKLKRSVAAGAVTTTATAAPTTAITHNAPTTPRGAAAKKKMPYVRPKRARTEMEDEDLSEDEDSADQASPAKKRVTPRRSVTRKSYKEEFSDEDEGNASANEASDGIQDDYLTSARATARTVDFGVPKADSAVSGMSSPTKVSEHHTPANIGDGQLGEELFRPVDSIARSKLSAPRPYDLFDGLVEDDADDSYMPLI